MRKISPALESDTEKFKQAAWKWLIGRVEYFQKNKTVPGAMKPGNYKRSELFLVGEMFLYHYDPKHKATLPYYDIFPLVIPIKIYDNGFLGLNLHYLPYTVRISFLNKLLELSFTPPSNKRTRMRLSYELLRDSAKFAAYIPCLKRYLVDHVRGKMMKILPHEWIMAVYLPVANWRKTNDQRGMTSREVWRDSMRKIRARKP